MSEENENVLEEEVEIQEQQSEREETQEAESVPDTVQPPPIGG